MAESSSLPHILNSLIAKIDSFRDSLDIAVYNHLLSFKETLLSTICWLRVVLIENEELHSTGIRYILHDAENVLDEFEYQILGKNVVNATDVNSIIKVPRFFSTSNVFQQQQSRSPFRWGRLPGWDIMTKKIKELDQRLNSCVPKVFPYYLNRRGTVFLNGNEDRRKRSLQGSDFLVDLCIPQWLMRRGEYNEIIIKLLMIQDPCDSLSVIPILGMEGMGKTTLAHSVFTDQRIDHSFESKIWVSLSHGINIRKVIAQIIKFLTGTMVEVEEQHINQLRNILQKQKFLLVLDDVWDMNPLKWEEFWTLIPSGMEGSKILVTTRSTSIASMMVTIPSHYLKGLYIEENKFPDLIKVGRERLNKCGAIPFTITIVKSRLLSKYEMHQWELMRDSQFCDWLGDTFLLSVLRLRYHHMPSYLRQCFELFSLYPNDFVFHSSEVASLWAALGLLPTPNKDKTFIDVANKCLHELLCKSFLHNFVNFGTSYYFQIHDFVIGLARDIAKYECHMVSSNIQNVPENVLHLSFAEDDLLGQSFTSKSIDVRTILFPIEGVGASSEAFLNMCVSRYKYLRTLDLSDSTYETLPSSTGKLKHLRFLSLERNEKIKRVPDSICKLYYLQVLNLAGCTKLEKLPKGLRNLISLRQLGITTMEAALPENDIANLISLEILNIESCQNLKSLFIGIKLLKLRTLTVTKCGSLKSLPLDVNHFPRLETLVVDNCGYLELTKGPDDQSSNLCLKAIHLQSLPQLLTLPYWLQESSNTLLSLLIVDCKNLEVLPEWLSTLTILGSFSTINCPKLTFLPNDIHRLTALGYLRIEGCPELCRKCQPHVGEYWPKISHINQIIIDEP